MKLKTKLLTIIAPAALLTTVAPIALTSCGGGDSSSTGITFTLVGEKTVTTTESTIDLEFTMSREKKTTETVVAEYSRIQGSVCTPTIKSISGKKAIVTFTHSATGTGETSLDLVFKGTDVSASNVWESKVSGITIKWTK